MSDLPSPDLPPPERARVEPAPPPKRLDALPVLYLVGFVILASALIYMWRHPSLPRGAVQDAARVATMRQELDGARQENEALTARVAALEGRPPPATLSLAPLEGRLAAVESRPTPNLGLIEQRVAAVEARKPDLGAVEERIGALEARKPADLGPLEARLAGLSAKLDELAPRLAQAETQGRQGADAVAALTPRLEQTEAQLRQAAASFAAMTPRLDQTEAQSRQSATALGALSPRLDQVEVQARQAAAGLQAVSERAQRFARVQAAGVALEAGQRLGDIAGAPPALARFAHDAPPTEAGLRLSFNTAAEAAHRASQPAITEDRPLLDRMWTRAQQSVTVRQGDRVLVGDPIAGVIAHARQLLDAGDLAGAVKALDGLAGPARAAMADWIDRAGSLLDARAAVAELAARG